MSKYVPYKEAARLSLEAIGILNTEWAMLVQGLPTIEIVHCGECRWQGFYRHCKYFRDIDFCSHGEMLVKTGENHEKVTRKE